MTARPVSDAQLRVGAALDGELDAAGMLALERAVADDPQIAAEYRRIAALQSAVREKLPRHAAPLRLRKTIAAMAPPRPRVFSARPKTAWLAYAATALLAAGLSAGATWFTLTPTPSSIGAAVIAGHMRGLLATAPYDVASSDRHTIKPWFDAHLGVSPPVPDLAAQGYELLGGRVDIIAGSPAPTLVYKAREHLISVTALASAANSRPPAVLQSAGGHRAMAWRGGDFIFWAASDIEPPGLEAFIAAFKQTQQP